MTGAVFVERRGPTIVIERRDSPAPPTSVGDEVAAVAIARLGVQGRPGANGMNGADGSPGPAGPPGSLPENIHGGFF